MAKSKKKSTVGSTPTVASPISSAAVEKTKEMNPATHPIGFQLDSAKKVTDKRLTTLPPSPPASALNQMASFASNTVQGPASIVELARALDVENNGPQLMFEYVYNNIEWEPGWGVYKGALGALMDGMGNSFDQSLLLAELLREAGYTANIIHGTIRLTEDEYKDWWNVTTIWGAQSYCANEFIPIVTAPTWTGTEWYMDIRHVWVEWDDNGTKYQFDPCYKQYSRKTGISNLSSTLGYNSATFKTNSESGATIDVNGNYVDNMNRANIRSDLETYTDNLIDHIRNNAVGSAPAGTATVDDVLGGKTIVPVSLPVLDTSLPHQQPGDTPTVWTGDVPASYKPTLQVQFPNWNTPGLWDFTYQTTSDNLAGKRLTLWYDGSLVPSLYLDGTSVATGLAQGVGTWTSIYLTVTHPAYAASNYPLSWQKFYQTNWQWWQSFIYAGGNYLIANAWGNLGRGQMDHHIEQVSAEQAAGGSSTSEAVLGSQLAVAWTSWAAQNSKVLDLVNRIKNCHTMYNHQIGVVAFDAGGSNSMFIDLGGVSGSSTNLANDVTQTPINDTVLAMHGVALEAAVCAQMNGKTPGISTTTVLDKANSDGDRIYKGLASNWSTGINIQNTLVTNGHNLTDMQNVYNWYIQWGNSVVIGDQPSKTMGTWSGWSYWAYPAAGAFGITNGTGKLGEGQDGEPDIHYMEEVDPDKDPRADPIDFFTGDYYTVEPDISIGSGEYPYKLRFERHYNSANNYLDGPLGLGWTHNFAIDSFVGSSGLTIIGEQSAVAAAATIANLYVNADLVSDTTRPVTKLVAMTIADNWWIDQIVNNAVVVNFPDHSEVFTKLHDGSYIAQNNVSNTISLSAGLYTLKTPQQVEYKFDADGKISTIEYPEGVTITFTYTAGKLTSVGNGLGRTLTFSYTADRLTSVSDGTGRTVSYTIDGNKNLTKVTNPNSKDTTYEYVATGLLTKIFYPANPLSPWLTNTYDSLNRVKEQKDGENNIWKLFFAGARSTLEDPLGNTSVSYYNRYGSAILEIDELGKETQLEYDGLNRLIKKTLPEGNSVGFTYDSKDNVLTVTSKAKSGSGLADIVNTFTYDSTWNKVKTAKDGLNNITTYTYDATKGNLLTIEKPAVGGVTPTVTMTYNNRGQMVTRTDETGIVTKFNYDVTTEKLTSSVEDEGVGKLNLTTSFAYNSRGDVTSETDPRGNVTALEYDVLRRMTKKTDPSPLSYVTKITYSDNSYVIKEERETGDISEPWQTVEYTYSVMDLLLTISDPSSNVTTFEYDELRRKKKETDAESQVTEYSYDAAGRLITVKDPSLTIAETRTYTDNGLLASLKDASNNTTTFTFDGHDRSDKTTYPDSNFEQASSYDANGNILTYRTRSGSTITYTYDELNRAKTREPQGQPTVTLTYDVAGRLIKASKPVASGDPSSGDFEYFYDGAGRFYKEKYPDSKIVEHVLDENGNVIKTTWPDSYFVERVYDELNRLTDVKLNGSSTSAAAFLYDKLSRRTKLTYGNGVVVDYTYEIDNDLVTQIDSFNGSSLTHTLAYNKVHQMTSQQVSDSQFMWHPAAAGTVTYATANNLNQYPTVGGATYSYNSNGCLTGDGTWTYTYDTENHLTAASKTGTTASYLYDPVQRQAQKQVGSTKTRFIYDGIQRIAEYDGSGVLQTRFVYGVSLDEVLLSITSSGTTTYFSSNHQDSITALTDSTGAVTNKYVYSPFGKSGSMGAITHGFTGQRYDSESGLYYYKARYYSPEIGRFLQPDPIGYEDGLNLYAYVNNDPLNLVDPTGEIAWPIVAAAVAIAAALAAIPSPVGQGSSSHGPGSTPGHNSSTILAPHPGDPTHVQHSKQILKQDLTDRPHFVEPHKGKTPQNQMGPHGEDTGKNRYR